LGLCRAKGWGEGWRVGSEVGLELGWNFSLGLFGQTVHRWPWCYLCWDRALMRCSIDLGFSDRRLRTSSFHYPINFVRTRRDRPFNLDVRLLRHLFSLRNDACVEIITIWKPYYWVSGNRESDHRPCSVPIHQPPHSSHSHYSTTGVNFRSCVCARLMRR